MPSPDQRSINVFAVLVTHNRPELLSEALAALATQTRRAGAVIIVDNASGPATKQVLDKAPLPIDVVRSEVNVGGAGGFALGMSRAVEIGADWMWLMDDDAIPHPDALLELCDQLRILPISAGAVCSSVIEFGEIALQHRRRFNTTLGFERALRVSDYQASLVRVDTASFVGFMVSAQAVSAVGLPNTDFFLSYDDTEYSLRLRQKGFDIWLAPASVIHHKRIASTRLRSTEFGPKHYFNIRNRIYVKRAYCSAPLFGGALGVAFGFLLWLRAPRRGTGGSWQMLTGAISDGFHGRLGGFPTRLSREKLL